jgi:PAS domain S-box-containing protein
MEAFFDVSPNALAIVDRDLRLVMTNGAFRRLSDDAGAVHAGQPLHEAVPRLAAVIEPTVRGVLDTGVAVTDIPVMDISEATAARHWLVHANPLRSGDDVLGVGIVVVDQSARARAEEALSHSELRFRELAENIDAVFWIVSLDGTAVQYVSPGFERVFGRPVEDVLVDWRGFVEWVHPDDRPAAVEAMVSADSSFEVEFRWLQPDGSIRWISNRGFSIRDSTGTPVRRAGIASDITRRKALEAQVRQAHRLDSIGRLAGGVAHDFNNLLAVVLGQSALAAAALDKNQCPRQSVSLITQTATRAAELTSQLLAFARRQVTQPVLLDLNDVVRGLHPLLRGLLRDDIDLIMVLEPDLGIVRADPTQVEQVLINLAVNAREAIANGGRVTVESATVVVDAGAGDVPPGRYSLLSVNDTGRGIPESARPFLFEPFFTTKHAPDATGLGLSTCWGIVQQHGGHIRFETEVGVGTTFKVYLPCVDAHPSHARDRADRHDRIAPSSSTRASDESS